MSAANPAIRIETREEARRSDVLAALARLEFKRRLMRACSEVALTWACALLLLILLAIADNFLLLGRGARASLVIPILFAAIISLARAIWLIARKPKSTYAAREIERASANRENTLVAFAENFESASRPTYMLARLENQARAALLLIDERKVAPRLWAVRGAAALVSLLLLLLRLGLAFPLPFARETSRILALTPNESSRAGAGASNANNEANATVTVDEIRVRVVPPAYSGLNVEETEGDAPIRALAGSTIEVDMRARGPIEGATLGFNRTKNAMRSLGDGLYRGSFVVAASGPLEARVVADERLAPAPMVRAVEVYMDAPPEARITEPQSDQLLREVPGNAVAVRWNARDDLGLSSATLKYIKSRGEGDAAKFTNGEVPLGQIERASAREWRGAASLDLTRLDVQPGDTFVFWIEVRDHNPQASGTGRSASLAIAIKGPEQVKLNLSDLKPNQIGEFLLTERIILNHTQKLHDERARLSHEELLHRSNEIAADQRDFKNSFNDYINIEGEGGHESATAAAETQSIEERVHEAENERVEVHNHGIPEPPHGAANSVCDMIYAIRAMWDAEDSLSTGDTAKALDYEREALNRLKSAQLSARYIPPIVAQSKPLDLKRRYQGELAEIKTRLERLNRRTPSRESAPVRAALAEAYAALGDLQSTLGVPASARASATARARERARTAADRLSSVGGDHAATIAEAVGQLRVVETELVKVETGGTSDEYAARISKPLALLTQAASNLFAIAESTTRAGTGGDINTLSPSDDTRAAEYFRKLAGSPVP